MSMFDNGVRFKLQYSVAGRNPEKFYRRSKKGMVRALREVDS